MMALMMYSMSLIGQTDFVWEKIDSTTLTKDQAYSATKLFIALKWKSAQDVIQLDDKDAGNIIVKGATSIQTQTFVGVVYTYYYTVNFKFKDEKIKVKISNLNCTSAIVKTAYGAGAWPLVQPSDDFPGYQKTSLTKPQFEKLMSSLKVDMQEIVTSYLNHMRAPSQGDTW